MEHIEQVSLDFVKKLRKEGFITFEEGAALMYDIPNKSVVEYNGTTLEVSDTIYGRSLGLRVIFDDCNDQDYDKVLYIYNESGDIDFCIADTKKGLIVEEKNGIHF